MDKKNCVDPEDIIIFTLCANTYNVFIKIYKVKKTEFQGEIDKSIFIIADLTFLFS